MDERQARVMRERAGDDPVRLSEEGTRADGTADDGDAERDEQARRGRPAGDALPGCG